VTGAPTTRGSGDVAQETREQLNATHGRREFFVVGVTHVDLAWKSGPEEMSEMMEVVVVRLLDALERNPDFKYHLEQAAHFRELARRRPDLIERLRPYVRSGSVEFAGGMASTLEVNLPNGECFVRNQELGLRWIRETFGVEPTTGWLVDTFGLHAQVPQLLRGFGIRHLLASRPGGTHTRDLFTARGLDGSGVTVALWNTNGGYTAPENVSWRFYKNWDDIDRCFAKADALTGPGPFLVMPYTENETLVSLRPLDLLRARDRDRQGESWHSATPADFFAAVDAARRELPVVDADLNPEFTGCFSLRQPIRLANRRAETRLLEAEKWAALTGLAGTEADLEEAWWRMAYVQFHDVFTGSHPTAVYHGVMETLAAADSAADAVLGRAFATPAPGEGDAGTFAVFNGLPWDRRDVVEVPLPAGWEGVSRVVGAGDGSELPFSVEGGVVRVRADAPAVGWRGLSLEPGPGTDAAAWEPAETAALENEWLRLDLDREAGLARLVWKPTGATLLEGAGALLVAQRDDGNFQIENPSGAEVAALAGGPVRLEMCSPSPLGPSARLSGEFPPLPWIGPDSLLRWQAELSILPDRPEVRLKLRVEWKGEATRVRLALPTLIEAASATYEVPFGTVRRRPYTPRRNAKGEWPAHRFVALEDGRHGVALANTGVAGVEVVGGGLYTTLLRAPKGEYAGMVADDTSSMHGVHEFTFALLPYAGNWTDAGVARHAQEFNSPLVAAPVATLRNGASRLRLEPADHVVLSSVRAAADGSGCLSVRVYETAGRPADVTLRVAGARAAWSTDLREAIQTEVPVADGVLGFSLRPFEIGTVLVQTE
jgi:alpha-mannosidase